jgi:hypothetical protein
MEAVSKGRYKGVTVGKRKKGIACEKSIVYLKGGIKQ